GHFYSRAHDILASCKAYMEGVQVGRFVKGGVRDVDDDGDKNSDKFKADLFGYVKPLVIEFEKIGVKDCQKFMSPTPLKPTTPIPTSLKSTTLKQTHLNSPKPTLLKKLFTLSCF
ncbi:putative ubiquitin-conjugating enzyme E2 25-like protein, partial [Trifolium pratense]